jgi:hypothetical protein
VRDLSELDDRRNHEGEKVRYGQSMAGDKRAGVFWLRSPDTGATVFLRIIADVGEGWDHVSVSTALRCPTWEEMDYVKRCFFKAQETAMQLHVPVKDHINTHPYCLHLWRPHYPKKIPLPPADRV